VFKLTRMRVFWMFCLGTDGKEFENAMRVRKWPEMTSARMARTIITVCQLQSFLAIGETLQEKLHTSLQLLRTAADVADSKMLKCQSDVVLTSDLGIFPSTVSLVGQLSGDCFADGLPGTVRYTVDQPMPPQEVGCMYIQMTTGDPHSDMAEALVLAAALAMSKVVVIPAGPPVDVLVRPLRIAIEDFSSLMLLPQEETIDSSFRAQHLVIVGPPGTRVVEGTVACNIVKSVLMPVAPQSFRVQYADDVADVIDIVNTE
jgi:hypothetical protein